MFTTAKQACLACSGTPSQCAAIQGIGAAYFGRHLFDRIVKSMKHCITGDLSPNHKIRLICVGVASLNLKKNLTRALNYSHANIDVLS